MVSLSSPNVPIKYVKHKNRKEKEKEKDLK